MPLQIYLLFETCFLYQCKVHHILCLILLRANNVKEPYHSFLDQNECFLQHNGLTNFQS